MIETKSQHRVLYRDTDMAGVVYYANYPVFFEAARTECFRQLGLPYSQLEREGIRLPVRDLQCSYKRPARYDDLLTIVTRVPEMPGARIVFEYEIYNEAGELLATGSTTLVFTKIDTGKPCRLPASAEAALRKHFE